MVCAATAILVVAVVGCDDRRVERDRGVLPLQDAVQTGVLEDRKLVESSGITPARLEANAAAGLFWSNNDSGNDEVLFAMDSSGRALGRWRVTGATNVDWEALSAGPCAEGACLYIADVGDNDALRRKLTIWRVPEPVVDGGTSRAKESAATAPAARLDFVYPDGAHDVEAIWVSPDTSIWLVTKRPHRARDGRFRNVLLFRLPPAAWNERRTVTAELVDSLPLTPVSETSDGWVTDAAFHIATVANPGSAAGDSATGARRGRVALRTYKGVVMFDADAATGRPGAVIARCSTRALDQRQAEAIAWLPRGRLLLTNEGRGSRLWAGVCLPK